MSKKSVKPTDNGRSSLEQLKKEYTRVIIKHDKSEDGSARTTVLLLDGNVLHVGVAKFSNRGDVFSRSHGRLIAQGRAELAAEVSRGKSSTRVSSAKQREALSYTIDGLEAEEVQEFIDRFLKVEYSHV